MRYLLALFLLLAGCGYKSASSYTKQALGDRVYTKVEIYLRDPQNAVLIKDAINKAVLSRFYSRLAPKEMADSIIVAKVKRVSFSPLEYDKNGYVVFYRTKVYITFLVKRGNKKESIQTLGIYDFPIEPNSVITDTKRYTAIKEGANKALDQFISRLALLGVR